ncbi:uncharacterized protein SAPINGB_P001379 [Magnusiomyces paraingens]|uniref:V-type proton ATPase subunit C n=1 Tax=Magnusiomyces paraingens TaxID=2606893 RepID=A0A5E8B5E5_9ASCO|nr:uncharacterized protein SAPINGB_P001379 [Saprochaete ingens]VVT46772.1 unnamed protein product [Saprochaete ingens]
MSEKVFYLVSVPASSAPSGGDPESQLENWYSETLGLKTGSDINSFAIPSFKIGTLDSLVQQSEDLAKLDAQYQGVVSKIADIISTLYDGNPASIASAKKIKDQPPQDYVKTFTWNTNKFRTDKSIPDLVDLISKETFALDNDVKTGYSTYTAAKANLSTIDRKQTGNLSIRSLHDVVRREHFVLDSEYLVTVLTAVPKSQSKEFLSSYETIVPMVVPRSASVIAQDDEYILYNTTLFKKYAPEFSLKSREHKWIPREFHYSEALVEDLKKEQQVAAQAERKQWADIVRLSRTAYADVVANWTHLKAIRMFVEAVLRYGLPPNFVNTSLYFPAKNIKKVEDALVAKFGYLSGNAFQKDKKGNLKTDSDLHEYGALVDTDYKPFVYYELDLF